MIQPAASCGHEGAALAGWAWQYPSISTSRVEMLVGTNPKQTASVMPDWTSEQSCAASARARPSHLRAEQHLGGR